jgi:hypothetical protein
VIEDGRLVVDGCESSGCSPTRFVVEAGEPGERFPVLDRRLRVTGEKRIAGDDPIGPGLLSGTTLPQPVVHIVDPPSVIPEFEGVGHGIKLGGRVNCLDGSTPARQSSVVERMRQQ